MQCTDTEIEEEIAELEVDQKIEGLYLTLIKPLEQIEDSILRLSSATIDTEFPDFLQIQQVVDNINKVGRALTEIIDTTSQASGLDPVLMNLLQNDIAHELNNIIQFPFINKLGVFAEGGIVYIGEGVYDQVEKKERERESISRLNQIVLSLVRHKGELIELVIDAPTNMLNHSYALNEISIELSTVTVRIENPKLLNTQCIWETDLTYAGLAIREAIKNMQKQHNVSRVTLSQSIVGGQVCIDIYGQDGIGMVTKEDVEKFSALSELRSGQANSGNGSHILHQTYGLESKLFETIEGEQPHVQLRFRAYELMEFIERSPTIPEEALEVL